MKKKLDICLLYHVDRLVKFYLIVITDYLTLERKPTQKCTAPRKKLLKFFLPVQKSKHAFTLSPSKVHKEY